MPQLILFSPCRKVIIDERDKTPSLISIFDRIQIDVPAGEEVPSDASALFEWVVFTWWAADESDQGKEFEQQLSLVGPDARRCFDEVTPFVINEQKHRLVARSDNFPIYLPGSYLLVLSLREVGQDWRFIAEYPITIEYSSQN